MSDLNIAIIATVVGGLILSSIIAMFTYAWRYRYILKERYLTFHHKIFKSQIKNTQEDTEGLADYITNFKRWV